MWQKLQIQSVYKATYLMLCKSLNVCITNENNLGLFLTSFRHESIVLKCNISTSITMTYALTV